MAEGKSPNHENPSGLNAQSGTLGPVGNQTFDPRVVDNMHAGFDSTLSLDFYSKYKRYLNPSSEDSNPDFPPSQCFKKYTDKSMGIVVPAKLTRPPYSDIHMTVIPGLSEAAAGNRLEQVRDIHMAVIPGLSEAAAGNRLQQVWDIHMAVIPGLSQTAEGNRLEQVWDIQMTVIPGLSQAAAGNRLEQVWDIYRTVTQLDSTKVSHLKGNNLTCNRLHHIITTYMIIGNY